MTQTITHQISGTILKHECSLWAISILHLLPFIPRLWGGRRQHTPTGACWKPSTSMKVHKQLISVLSWAMKLSHFSITSPEGGTRHSPPPWTEQKSSERHPGRRLGPGGQESALLSPPGTGPWFCREGECLWVPGCSCWSPWGTWRASLCAGHWERKEVI